MGIEPGGYCVTPGEKSGKNQKQKQNPKNKKHRSRENGNSDLKMPGAHRGEIIRSSGAQL